MLELTGASTEAFTVYQSALNSISALPDGAEGVELSLPDPDESPVVVIMTSAMNTASPSTSASHGKQKHELVGELVRKVQFLHTHTTLPRF